MALKQDSTLSLWLNYFRPNAYAKSIRGIDLAIVQRQGVRCVFCDLDNTLAPHFTRLPTREAFRFKQQALDLGLLFVVVSNNKRKRVASFCALLKPTAYLYSCKKPMLWKIKRYMRENDLTPDQCVIIGDQFLTDILAANRLKCRSVLVLPLFVSSVEGRVKGAAALLERYLYDKLSQRNVSWEQEAFVARSGTRTPGSATCG